MLYLVYFEAQAQLVQVCLQLAVLDILIGLASEDLVARYVRQLRCFAQKVVLPLLH